MPDTHSAKIITRHKNVVSINSGVDVDISDVDDDADKKSFSFTEDGVEDEIIESPEENSEAL